MLKLELENKELKQRVEEMTKSENSKDNIEQLKKQINAKLEENLNLKAIID